MKWLRKNIALERVLKYLITFVNKIFLHFFEQFLKN